MTQSSPSQADPVAERPLDLHSLIRGRRSVRKLRPDPVPRSVIDEAIGAAGWAPSPHGRQPWRFAVVQSASRKLELADAMAASWDEQLRLDGQPEAVVRIRLDKSRQRVQSAPAIVVPCLYTEPLDVYPDEDRRAAERTMAIQSLGAAIQNLLLSVYAAGYDAGWMCAPLFCPDVVRTVLRLPDEFEPHALIPIGLAEADPVRRPRVDPSALIVSWT